MEISETGVINPTYIYNTSFDGEKSQLKSAETKNDAVYTDISAEAQTLASQEVEQTKLLELLGPAVTEKYSDLLASISKSTNRTQHFIEKLTSSVDLYA